MIKLSINHYDDVLKLIPLKPENVVVHYSLLTRKAFMYVDQPENVGAMVIQPNLPPPQLRLYLFDNKKWDLLKAYLTTTCIKLIVPCDSNLMTHLEDSSMISKYLDCSVLVLPDNIKTLEVKPNQNILPLTKAVLETWAKQDPQNVFLKIGLEAILNNLPCLGYFIKDFPVHISTAFAVAGNYCEIASWTEPDYRRKGYFKATSAYFLSAVLSKGMIPIGISGKNFVTRMLKGLGMKEEYRCPWFLLK